MFKSLSEGDLVSFQEAVLKDYGIKLEGEELYRVAFNLLQFIEALIKFDQVDKKKAGSKTIQNNPLYPDIDKDKME